SHAGEAELARFRTEAEAAARLQHPNIVQIYEVGEQDGLHYLALEFVDGESLAQKWAGNPPPPRVAARLVQALAQAMDYAHQRGVVHGDLKPANILVSGGVVSGEWSGDSAASHHSPLTTHQIKITDFGLAKHLHGEPGASAPGGQTQTGAVLGTPGYMAPE